MASWQATFASFLLRRLFKPRLARAPDVAAVRKVMSGPKSPASRGTRAVPAAMGSVAGEWIVADTRADQPTLLYLHGGGFIACTPGMYRPVTCAFALGGYRTFVPDYRLAPEHPFPAALDDVVNAYRALVEEVGPKRLVLAGDSAGGGLAMALLVSLREQGMPPPAAAALFSPFVDIAASGASVHANAARCAMFTPHALSRVAHFYVGERDPLTPLVSPLYADLHGLPPLLIHVGADETLLDDSRRLADRARAAGVDVTLRIWPAVPHVWQLFNRWIPEGRESIAEACAFFATHTHRTD